MSQTTGPGSFRFMVVGRLKSNTPLFPLQQWDHIVQSNISCNGQIGWSAQFGWWSPTPTIPAKS